MLLLTAKASATVLRSCFATEGGTVVDWNSKNRIYEILAEYPAF
jgi:hypothetical protein